MTRSGLARAWKALADSGGYLSTPLEPTIAFWIRAFAGVSDPAVKSAVKLWVGEVSPIGCSWPPPSAVARFIPLGDRRSPSAVGEKWHPPTGCYLSEETYRFYFLRWSDFSGHYYRGCRSSSTLVSHLEIMTPLVFLGFDPSWPVAVPGVNLETVGVGVRCGPYCADLDGISGSVLERVYANAAELLPGDQSGLSDRLRSLRERPI